MNLEITWLALLGLLLAGYLVLGGYDYGVQMLRPLVGHDERARRSTLAALGPFFFGNEVWLIAFAGVLFGAFPFFEGTLLSGLYGPILVLLVGLVVGKAAVQLRGRARSAAGRRTWDILAVAGGIVPAASWGVIIGILLHGVPRGADGTFTLPVPLLLHPFVLLCGITAVALFAAHGATFLAMRLHGALAVRASTLARPLLVAAAVGTLASFAAAVFLDAPGVTNPLPAILLVVSLVTTLLTALTTERNGSTFAATCCATALPVLLVGAGLYPNLLSSTVNSRFTMTISEGAADMSTLTLLLSFGVVLIPVIVGYQIWSWWLFRGRVSDHDPSYF